MTSQFTFLPFHCSFTSQLHYLELVIVALHEKGTAGRRHIPYRNSMMTSGIYIIYYSIPVVNVWVASFPECWQHMNKSGVLILLTKKKKKITLLVLRDSLGGNCKTIMLATINPEAEQTEVQHTVEVLKIIFQNVLTTT